MNAKPITDEPVERWDAWERRKRAKIASIEDRDLRRILEDFEARDSEEADEAAELWERLQGWASTRAGDLPEMIRRFPSYSWELCVFSDRFLRFVKLMCELYDQDDGDGEGEYEIARAMIECCDPDEPVAKLSDGRGTVGS